MNGASNQLFAGSGLTQDQDRGNRGGHLLDLREYSPKWFGGADDFFEHGGPYDVFAQRNVFVAHPVFRSLAIVDVGSRGIPAHETPLFVAERVVTDEEPTVLAILPPCALFDLKRQAAGKG